MAEFLLFLIIFVGIMALSALIFGGWFIVMLVRGIASFLGLRVPEQGRRFRSGAVQVPPLGANQRQCSYELCKAINDSDARFCRRCGREMAPPQHVNVRRAAVW